MSTKIWGTTYLASGYCWVQILMLWLGSGVVAVLVYGILHQVNDKTIASLQTGLRISDTLRTLAAFILGFYLEKTINIWWTLRHDTLQQLMNIVSPISMSTHARWKKSSDTLLPGRSQVDNMCLRMAIYFPGNSYEDRHARLAPIPIHPCEPCGNPLTPRSPSLSSVTGRPSCAMESCLWPSSSRTPGRSTCGPGRRRRRPEPST